jgi:hypothetical protein
MRSLAFIRVKQYDNNNFEWAVLYVVISTGYGVVIKESICTLLQPKDSATMYRTAF